MIDPELKEFFMVFAIALILGFWGVCRMLTLVK